MVYRPDLDLKRLTPGNKEELLFNDILWAARAQEEHDQFVSVLENQDVEVFRLNDLLKEALSNDDGKRWLLDKKITPENYGTGLAPVLKQHLSELSPGQLAKYLTGGLTLGEAGLGRSSLFLKYLEPDDFLMPPLPNHLFTRDTSCWIGGGVSINPMATSARRQEALNAETVYRFHPLFRQQDFPIWFGSDAGGGNTTIEGGDVMTVTPDTVLVGLSKRTTPPAVEALAENLFYTGEITKVIAAGIPKSRSYMHLDTVLCMISRSDIVIYPDVVRSIKCWELTPGKGDSARIEQKDDFLEVLRDNLAAEKLNIIETGGDRYESAREQWDDGNNVLAVEPGKIITYERNEETNKRFRDAGIEVLTIPGSELSRGQGGPHCMSCPIQRDAI